MRKTAIALVAAFVANGLAGAAFLARLPERQRSLDLSDAGLGLVLLGMAGGALVASPFAGRAVTRFGSRQVVTVSGVGLGATLWCAGAAPTPFLFFGALAIFGALDAAMDISMNANGAAFEEIAHRSVLHRLHAAWSLGVLFVTGVAAACAALEVSLTLQLVAVGAAIAALTLWARTGLVPLDRTSEPGPAVERRRARFAPLVFLAIAAFGGAIIEGAPADWGAIRLERMGVATGASALGLAVFMAGMLVGRLVGDALTDRFGGGRVLRVGTLLVASGVAFGVAVDEPWAFVSGLALAGFGTSGVFPLAFSAAGRTPGVSPGLGAATVSLTARIGFLCEPVIMGTISELTNVRTAYALVVVVALVLTVLAPRICPRDMEFDQHPRLHGVAGGGA